MEALILLIALGLLFWAVIREAAKDSPKLPPPKKLPELPKKALTKPTYVRPVAKPPSPILAIPKKRSEFKEKPVTSFNALLPPQEHSSDDGFANGVLVGMLINSIIHSSASNDNSCRREETSTPDFKSGSGSDGAGGGASSSWDDDRSSSYSSFDSSSSSDSSRSSYD